MKNIITIMMVLFAATASASDTRQELKFITIDVAPWASINSETGKTFGVFQELVSEIEKRSKYTILTTLSPFARVDRELESGHQDCTILVKRDENIVNHGALISHHAIGIIARKGIQLKTYDDLLPLTVSVLRGAQVAPKFDNDSRIKKEFDTNYQIGLRKIAHKRLDAIAGALPTVRFLAEQEGLSEHLGEELLLLNVPLLLQCSKNSPAAKLLPELNNIIENMHKDGTLDRIKSKYHF